MTTNEPKKQRISFHLEIEATLDLEAVFPDGVPENVSIDHVISAVKQDGGPRRILSDWDLMDRPSMDISAFGKHATVDWDGEPQEIWDAAAKQRIVFEHDETCDECDAPLAKTGSLVGPYHYTHCSLHEAEAKK